MMELVQDINRVLAKQDGRPKGCTLGDEKARIAGDQESFSFRSISVRIRNDTTSVCALL